MPFKMSGGGMKMGLLYGSGGGAGPPTPSILPPDAQIDDTVAGGFPYYFRGQNADVDLDIANDRYVFDGVTYASRAAAVTAGKVSLVTGADQWDFGRNITPTEIICRVTFIPSGASTTVEVMARIGDGTTSNRMDASRSTTNTTRCDHTRNSSAVSVLLAGNPTVGVNNTMAAGSSTVNLKAFGSSPNGGVASGTGAIVGVPANISKIRVFTGLNGGTALATTQVVRVQYWLAPAFCNAGVISAAGSACYAPKFSGQVGTATMFPHGAVIGNYTYLGQSQGTNRNGIAVIMHDGTHLPHLVYLNTNTNGPGGADDHAGPSVLKHSSGKIVMACTSHGTTKNGFLYVHDPADDSFTSSTIDVTLNNTFTTGKAEYVNLFEAPDGTIIWWGKNTDYTWGWASLTLNSDNTITQSALGFQVVINDPTNTIKNYVTPDWLDYSTRTTMRLLGVPNSNGGSTYIAIADWNMATGDITSGDGSGNPTVVFNTGSGGNSTGATLGNLTKILNTSAYTLQLYINRLGTTIYYDAMTTAGAATYSRARLTTPALPYLASSWTFESLGIPSGVNYNANNASGLVAIDNSVLSGENAGLYVAYRDDVAGYDYVQRYEFADASFSLPLTLKKVVCKKTNGAQFTLRVVTPGNPSQLGSASKRFPCWWQHFDTFVDYNSNTGAALEWQGNYVSGLAA